MKNITNLYSTIVAEFEGQFTDWQRGIPPLLRGAFSTEVFREQGFSDNVIKLTELHHFSGGQHVHGVVEACNFLDSLIVSDTLLTYEELFRFYSRLESVWDRDVYPLSLRGEQPLLCLPSALRSMVAFESVQALFPDFDKKPKIMEWGAGSAYLSAALSLAGYEVSTLEISLSYGIWQRLLFNLLKKEFIAESSHFRTAPVALDPASLYSLRPALPFKPDLVIANHMINEMSRHSLAMALRSLDELEISAPILAEGWGFGSRTDGRRNGETENIMNWFGYELEYHLPPPIDACGVTGTRAFPVSVFTKVRKPALSNLEIRGLKIPLSEYCRDLRKPVFKSQILVEQLKAKQASLDSTQLVERLRALGLFNGNSPIRLENKWLDYIGLNSNTKRAYVRSTDGVVIL